MIVLVQNLKATDGVVCSLSAFVYMKQLFSTTKVDEEFGCFSAILSSSEGSYKGRAIAQIQTGGLTSEVHV